MRAIVAAAVIGVCAAAAVPGVGTLAPPIASAAGCKHVTVKAGTVVGRVTLRIKRRGKVSCSKAAHLTRAYFRRFAAGKCGRYNNFCWLDMGHHWTCGIYSTGLSQHYDGAMSFCAVQRRGGAAFQMFRVRLKRVKNYKQFLSPNGKTWCQLRPSLATCGYVQDGGTDGTQRSGTLDRDGRVTLCSSETTTEHVCTQNWGVGRLHVLKAGQQVKRGGFTCRSAANRITCTIASGAGFRISATEVVKVGPAT